MAWGPGGFIYEAADMIGRSLGFTLIASMPFDIVGMATSKLPPSPGDPDAPKNLKIRIWASKVAEALMERMGYMPTVMPWADVYSGMQMGVVDGVFGAGVIGAYENIRDVMDYWIPYYAMSDGFFYIINLELWNSLSAEDQKIIQDAAILEQDKQMEAAETKEAEYLQKTSDYGIEVIELTPLDMENIANAVMEDVWPELIPMVGKTLLDDAKAYVESIR